MYGRDYYNCLKGLLQIITVTRHVTSVLPLMTSKFELVTSSTDTPTPLCSVDVASLVLQMARGDMAGTCAMECLKDGCCLLYQFHKESFQCKLFEYTTTNFSVIPSCTSQRITMRAGQPVVTKRTEIDMYRLVDRSNGLCNLSAQYYIVSAMNQKVVDIRVGSTNLVTMTKQTGKLSQMWYFDAQGYVRSAVNGYGVDIVGSGCDSCYQLIVVPFNGSNSNQKWTWVPASNWLVNTNVVNGCFTISGGTNADNIQIISYWCNVGLNEMWSLVQAA